MKLIVEFQMVDDDPFADPNRECGVTPEGYKYIIRALPGYDVEVHKAEEMN